MYLLLTGKVQYICKYITLRIQKSYFVKLTKQICCFSLKRIYEGITKSILYFIPINICILTTISFKRFIQDNAPQL